jgi:hypothetical protein
MPIAHWPGAATHGTCGKQQGDGLGLRQRVKGCGARSLARSWVRGRLVGSGRGRRVCALQVFDAQSAHRAQTNEAKRKNFKELAC